VETFCRLALPVTGCWVAARSLCVHTVGSDLKTAWRLSFVDESSLEVCMHYDALHKLTSYLLPYLKMKVNAPGVTSHNYCIWFSWFGIKSNGLFVHVYFDLIRSFVGTATHIDSDHNLDQSGPKSSCVKFQSGPYKTSHSEYLKTIVFIVACSLLMLC